MIVYQDKDTPKSTPCFWEKEYNRIQIKKKQINEYNTKLALIEALKKIGLPSKFAENDVVLESIVSIIQNNPNSQSLFFPLEFYEITSPRTFVYPYDGGCKIRVEMDNKRMQEHFHRLIEDTYHFLKNNITIEKGEENYIIKACLFEYYNDASKYVLDQDFNVSFKSPNLHRIVISEIICDALQDDISCTKKEIYIEEREQFSNQINRISIYTKTNLFHINEISRIISAGYSGPMMEPAMSFIDNVIPNQERLEIVVNKDNTANATLEDYRLGYNITTTEGNELHYIQEFTNYIECQQYKVCDNLTRDLFLESHVVCHCPLEDWNLLCEPTEDYMDILSDKQLAFYEANGIKKEDYMINAEYQKFMGITKKIDDRVIDDIIVKLRNQKYEKWQKTISHP